MDHITKINKIKFILNRQVLIFRKRLIIIQSQVNEADRKLSLLKMTLDDYEKKIKQANTQTITVSIYNQFMTFNDQLRKAIQLQDKVVMDLNAKAKKEMNQIQYLDKKIKDLEEYLAKIKKSFYAQIDRREGQETTDLFNQMKYH